MSPLNLAIKINAGCIPQNYIGKHIEDILFNKLQLKCNKYTQNKRIQIISQDDKMNIKINLFSKDIVH